MHKAYPVSSVARSLYQNTSNCGVEISPMLWVLGFHIEIKKEIFKNLLVPNRKGWSCGI